MEILTVEEKRQTADLAEVDGVVLLSEAPGQVFVVISDTHHTYNERNIGMYEISPTLQKFLFN